MDHRKSLPADFPDLDLPAWNAALPFPGTPPVPPAIMRLVLSPREAREIARRRKEEKPWVAAPR